MGMTPRGLRRLDDGARHEEALERRRSAATARRDLETAVGRVNELQRELSRTRNEAALAGIAARIGAQAGRAAPPPPASPRTRSSPDSSRSRRRRR